MSSEELRLLLPPISPAASLPLYEQVVVAIRREVQDGRLAPGAALPSFRALAADLRVSLITVKRAYEELEREGVIYRKQGLGTFVAEAALDRSQEAARRESLRLLAEAWRAAKAGRLNADDFLHHAKHITEEKESDV